MNPKLQEQSPKVSVLMLTYNHERFIAQAIESVLMQETDFPFELVIGEDCSTDKTPEIVERFAALRPDVIRAVLNKKNVGPFANFGTTLDQCRGSYIATLEGDDYWISPSKLQKQVDFLERHPDHTLCGTRFMHVHGDQTSAGESPSPHQKESGGLEDILRWNYLLTCSVVFRAGVVPRMPEKFTDVRNGDMVLWSLLAEHGRVGFINEIMAAYRLHEGGVWTGASIETRMAALEYTINSIHTHLGNRHPKLHRESLCLRYVECAGSHSQAGDFASARRWLRRAFLKSPATFLSLPNARQCLRDQFIFQVLHPLRNARIRCAGKYYRTRIWAGAHRRRWWRALTGRPHGANPGSRE